MSRKIKIVGRAFSIASISLLLHGCFLPSNSSSSLTCTAVGTLASGQALSSDASVTLSSIAVTITGSSSDSYSIAFPDGSTDTTNSLNYTDSNSMTVVTNSSSAIISQITVTDTSSQNSAACTISSSGSSSPTSGALTITAAPSANVSSGGSIQLSLTASETPAQTYFLLETGSCPLMFKEISPSEAQLTEDPNFTDCAAQGTTVTVYQMSSATNTQVAQATIQLTFGSSNYSGQVTLSPSASSGAVGSTLTLTPTVTGIDSPSYTYLPLESYRPPWMSGNLSALSVTPNTDGTASVTATQPGLYTIEVYAVSSDEASELATAQVTVQFQ